MHKLVTFYPRGSSSTIASAMKVVGVQGAFRHDQSQFTLDWIFENNDKLGVNLQTFAQEILGYSSKFGVATPNLLKINRRVPAQCPYAPWLFASHITSMRPSGPNEAKTYGATKVQGYKLWTATVVYESPPYRILENNSIGNSEEWKRFTIWNGEPSVQFVQQEQGHFVWGNTAKQAGEAITKSGGLSIRKVKKKIIIDWLGVPDDGLFTNGGLSLGGNAPKQDAGLGRVNFLPWPSPGGFPSGTLLLEGWTHKPHTFTTVESLATSSSAVSLLRSWDVQFIMSYFNPPQAKNTFAAFNNDLLKTLAKKPNIPGGLKKLLDDAIVAKQQILSEEQYGRAGHNLVPNPVDNLWHYVQIPGMNPDDPSGWKYNVYNFDSLFELNA